MTANKNIPITKGERRRKTARLFRERIREWRTQIQELLAAAYGEMISQKINPTAERLLLQVYPQVKAVLPRIFNSEMKNVKQNHEQNDGEVTVSTGVFTMIFKDEERDENDHQNDVNERQSGGAQHNDGENQNIGIFNITFEGEEKDDDGEDNVGEQ